MKRISCMALLFALLLSPFLADAATQKGTTLQNSYAGTGDANGKVLDVAGYTTATFQVSGTFSGTIIPEVSLTGASYTILTCFQMDGTTPITSFVSTGSWRCNITGHGLLRARISSYTSGSITVDVTVTDGGTAITKLNGGGGGGGGAPTNYAYWGIGLNSNLPNAVDLSTLNGLILDTGGTPSTYAGVTCTNQVMRLLSSAGATNCVTISSTYVDGSIAVTASSNNWGDGIKQTFNPNNTFAGINDGSNASDPTTAINGDRYYNSTLQKFRCYENGVWVNCVGSGGASDFGSLTSGTNTAALVEGSGGTLLPSGTGVIGASTIRPSITIVNGGNTPYNVGPTDYFILCDTSGGPRVVNLLAATNKMFLQFKNIGSNSCTVNRAGTDLIDGGTTATMTQLYEAFGIASDGGATWNVF